MDGSRPTVDGLRVKPINGDVLAANKDAVTWPPTQTMFQVVIGIDAALTTEVRRGARRDTILECWWC